jgi:hypothetical protein
LDYKPPPALVHFHPSKKYSKEYFVEAQEVDVGNDKRLSFPAGGIIPIENRRLKITRVAHFPWTFSP